MKLSAVILAAGKGLRMRSDLPKVAHKVAGKPIILHVIKAVKEAGIEDIAVVVGHGREIVQEICSGEKIRFVLQEEQLGTGHALMQAEAVVAPEDTILVLAGDIPLIQAETLRKLIKNHRQKQATATVLSVNMRNPSGYGRILRDKQGAFLRIIEEKDANDEEKGIKEINSGIYCFSARKVFSALHSTSTRNAQGEYYLTEALELLKNQQESIGIFLSDGEEDIYGINDRVQLVQAENILRQRKNRELMLSGVSLMDPASTFIDSDVLIGHDTIILPFSIIEGNSRIGERCEIGPGTRISDSIIGNEVKIESSRLIQASVADRCNIGPFAYLRPETTLQEGVKIGDFVEIKKSTIGSGSKIPHLSYVGDATIGQGVNVGAGTITCNYDGKNKYQTVLEDRVFIGSNTNLVAPVRIGENSITGAGSTISRDVPPHTLAVERAGQKHLPRRG
mgnify:FL=1